MPVIMFFVKHLNHEIVIILWRGGVFSLMPVKEHCLTEDGHAVAQETEDRHTVRVSTFVQSSLWLALFPRFLSRVVVIIDQ